MGEVTGLDFSGVISALQGALTAQQLITYLASVITVGISLYVAYTLVRKALGMFSRAIRGKAPTA